MKFMKKTAAILLLLAMLLTSCSENSQSPEETEASAPETQAVTAGESETEPEESTDYLAGNFADVNFDGKNFTMITRAAASAQDAMPEFNHEEITGEPVADAIYNQVVTVEEKLNAAVDYYASRDVNSDIRSSSAAGDTTYKTAINSNQLIPQLVTQNLLLDLNQLEVLNFDNPWWNRAYRDQLTVGGKTYFGFGDLFFEAGINNVHLFYFNKDMCDEYGLPYPYEAVNEGKWTMDYVMNMVTGVAKDLDGNGTMDANDQWGLVHSPIQSSIMFYTGGFRLMSFDEEGYPYLDMYSEEFVNFYEKLWALDFKTEGVRTINKETENFKMFADGRVLLSSHFLTVTPTLREVEFEVGILPYPKYTEESEYVNWPTAGNFLMAVPSVADPEDYNFIGTMLEALSAQGYRFVRPALYEVTLQGKLARDRESQDMLDLIFDTMSVDFGWIHTGDSGMGWFVNMCIGSELENISSVYNRLSKRAVTHYDGIVEYYKNND